MPPLLPIDERKSCRIVFLVTEDEYLRMVKETRERGYTSISHFIRDHIPTLKQEQPAVRT